MIFMGGIYIGYLYMVTIHGYHTGMQIKAKGEGER